MPFRTCRACNDKGYLIIRAMNELEAVHGRLVHPDKRDIAEIQKCDNCRDDDYTDDTAQHRFLSDLYSGVVDLDELPTVLLLWKPGAKAEELYEERKPRGKNQAKRKKKK